ncbi:ABC transporter ATP-binding protein [Erysipelothrix rhusiopathiae]|uniref:ABC transporter ATP-binding protein n=1 Tax=Erysipelothrix rhusiopathiae TaxID=1648 RepID=UPI002B248E22|nr:ABC transporter ATP-binding protein [Erysipelothrix rhusiopathiae]WRB92529.1 ABC transporter ATP-binding protein [Erysipelothrix rhusiopathiae]
MNKPPLMRLLKYTKPHRKYLYKAVIYSILQVASILVGPYIIGKMIDLMVGPGAVDFNQLPRYFVYFGLSVISGTIAQWGVSRSTNALSYRTVQDLRNDMMVKINSLSLKTLDSISYGSIVSLMTTDIDLIANGLLNGGAQFITGILTIFGTIALMFYTQINITFLVLLLTPLSLVVAHIIATSVYEKFQEQSKIRGDITSFVEAMITHQALVKNVAYEQDSQKRLKALNEDLYQVGWFGHFVSASIYPATRVVNNSIYIGVGVYGALLVRNHALTIGALSAFLTYANQYMKPFNEISSVMSELQAALASSSRVFEIIDLPNELDAKRTETITKLNGNVSFENVAFSYDENHRFIENLNLNVQIGQTVAIVGPTGCGKTTLMNLLMAFYDCDEGVYSLDGINTERLSRAFIRSQFGMVLQDTWIFSGSVADNISYGMPNASRKLIIEAAKKAAIHDVIEQLPNGYDTILSTKSESLSQGEQQLLCIARVLVLDPPMLILDEATSSIDTRTELSIQKAFDTMMVGRTSFIIAHRLSTIVNADVILVMDDGKIVEYGNHHDLLKRKGYYEKLYSSQFNSTPLKS